MEDSRISQSQHNIREEDNKALQPGELSSDDKLFIQYYTETLNKAQSYKRVFPEFEGKDVKYRVNKLLDRPEIKQEINIILQRRTMSDVSESPALLLHKIKQFLEIDPATYYKDDGTIIPMSELTEEQRVLISNIDKQINNRSGGVVLSYQLPSKSKLLDQLTTLVAMLAKEIAKNAGDSGNDEEAKKKRDKIFGSVLDEAEEVRDEVRKKRGRGRPSKWINIDELDEATKARIEERLAKKKAESNVSYQVEEED